MRRKQDELLSMGKAFSGLPDPVKALTHSPKNGRLVNEHQERGLSCFRLAGKTCANGFDRPRWYILSRILGAKRPLKRARFTTLTLLTRAT